MGAYFQKQLVQNNQKKIVVNPSMLKFMECNYLLNEETQAVLRYLQVHASQKNPIAVTTVCDADDEKDWLQKGIDDNQIGFTFPFSFGDTEGRWERNLLQEPVIGEFKQYFDDAQKAKPPVLVGYLVCPSTETYINLQWLSNIALMVGKQRKSMIDPLSLLTRRTTYKMGGGDFNFCYDPDYYRQFTTWANKPIYFTDNAPDSDYQDISAYVCFDYNCEPLSDEDEISFNATGICLTTYQTPTPTTTVTELIDKAICNILNTHDDDVIEKKIINPFLSGDNSNVCWSVFPDWSSVAEYPILAPTEESKNSLETMLNTLFVNRLNVVYWFKIENGLKTWEQLDDAECEQAFTVWSNTSRAKSNYFCDNDLLIQKISVFLSRLDLDFILTYNNMSNNHTINIKGVGQFFRKKGVTSNNELIPHTIGLIARYNSDFDIVKFGVEIEKQLDKYLCHTQSIDLNALFTNAINSFVYEQKQREYLERTCRTMFYQYKNCVIHRLLDIESLREVR